MVMNIIKDRECNCVSCGEIILFSSDEFTSSFKNGEREWGQELECPHCKAATRIYRMYETPPPPEYKYVPILEPEKPKPESEQLRALGENFINASYILIGIGVVIFAFTILAAFLSPANESEQNFLVGCGISSPFLASSAWLFLTAQIIYIRANTCKETPPTS